MIERSLAIKSPSIHYHLAGTKKVQQRLAEKGMLEHFLPGPENKEKVEKVRSIFTGLYELRKDVRLIKLNSCQEDLSVKVNEMIRICFTFKGY